MCWQRDNINVIGSCAPKQGMEFENSSSEAQALLSLFNKLCENSNKVIKRTRFFIRGSHCE